MSRHTPSLRAKVIDMKNDVVNRERRARYSAKRQGYRIFKIRESQVNGFSVRDQYFVIDGDTRIIQTSERGVSLDEVEAWLSLQ